MNLTDLNSNEANYNLYLKRMTESCCKSSKGLIPVFCKGKVLDVGCGSGVLLEQLENAKGIDINKNSVQVCRQKGLNAECIPLEKVKEKFDTIIFSSVLHEFSSYASYFRYGSNAILKALSTSYDILNYNGRVIIRDGVKAEPGVSTVKAKDYSVVDAITKFAHDAPMFNLNQIELSINGLEITAKDEFLKEFMFTYTWGPESYFRESKEQYGILTVSRWESILESAGFRIVMTSTFAEEYLEYLSKHFERDRSLYKLLNKSTILIVAEKKN